MVDPSGQTILPPFNTTAPAYLESEGQTRELSLANRPVGYLVDINLCLWASVGRKMLVLMTIVVLLLRTPFVFVAGAQLGMGMNQCLRAEAPPAVLELTS